MFTTYRAVWMSDIIVEISTGTRTSVTVDNTGIPLRYHRDDSVVVFRYYHWFLGK